MITLLLPALIILAIVEIFLVEFEKFGWTTFSLIATAIAVYYFKLFGIPMFVATHIGLCLSFTLGYVVAGVFWSYFKLYSYTHHIRSKNLDLMNKFVSLKKEIVDAQWKWIQDNHITRNGKPLLLEGLPLKHYDSLSEDFEKTGPKNRSLVSAFTIIDAQYDRFCKPRISDLKSKLISWMCYWPFSFIGTFFNDPVRKLFLFIFSSLTKSYQKLIDSVFSDFPDK